MGKRELVALLNLSSWCFEMVVWLFLAVTWVCLQFVVVVFPDHTHFVVHLRLMLCSFNMDQLDAWTELTVSKLSQHDWIKCWHS